MKVKRDAQMLGRLRISNGSLVWVPANKQFGFKINWSNFERLMQEQGEGGHR